MSKNNIIIALVVLCLIGTIWGSVQDKKSESLERQIAAMKEQSHATAQPAATGGHSTEAVQDEKIVAELKIVKTRNEKLKKNLAEMKAKNGEMQSSMASQQLAMAEMEKKVAEAAKKAEELAVMQAQRSKRSSVIADLEAKVAELQAELNQKVQDLAVAEENARVLDGMKNELADAVDAYAGKAQELANHLEGYELRIASLEKALEERTKVLVDKGQELARTQLNMKVLLSKIESQNNSIAILEETRLALEQELSNKFLVIEELQQQLSAQVVDNVVTEEVAAH